ncbi:MAG TPA: URC4/urg3 family protein [Xanthobacteraceae bacterium]|jgi:hypothetical protein|nr:URC4/urg3 family protein [Xanthobacteraceae bacterium]
MSAEADAAIALLNAEAVRIRAHRMLALGLDGQLPHFRVELSKLDAAADLVVATTREAYPTLAIPFHSRWRHFVVRGENRYDAIRQSQPDRFEQARTAFDLAIVSTILDAGAGSQWQYRDFASGESFASSEGLALASLAMFAHCAFSSDLNEPMRADAVVLEQLTTEQLMRGFQVSDSNPLVGIEGRCGLLRALGKHVAASPAVFARDDRPRPGGLFDHLRGLSRDGIIPAPLILSEILHHLGPIWPSRISLGGVALGDCWRHPAIVTMDATNNLVPLHKLSQWLTYSLIDPLQGAGLAVTDIEGLTGLAEYRNGGLFVDTGVLALRDESLAVEKHDIGSPLVVEWRALTVALLDQLAAVVRAKLGSTAAELPLAKVLEGGSWAAGRKIARARRADGSPPIKIASDGTVF